MITMEELMHILAPGTVCRVYTGDGDFLAELTAGQSLDAEQREYLVFDVEINAKGDGLRVEAAIPEETR